MGFLDQLRMQHIFPSDGNVLNPGTPFGMPDMNAGNINLDLASQIANRETAHRMNAVTDPTGMHQGIARPAPSPMGGINPSLMPGTSTTKPMDVVWGNDSYKEGNIKPLDLAKLDQNAEKIRQAGEKNKSTAELGQSKLDLAGELGRSKLDVSQQRADALDFKAKHPNAQFLQPKGGNIMMYDPATQTMHDTGIKTGTMTQEDLLNTQAMNKQEEIGSRGAESANVQSLRNEGNLAGIAAKVAGAKEKQKIGALPTQQKVDYANKAQRLINSNPELAPFVKFNSDGTFNVVAPSNGILGGHHGPTEEQFRKINESIYGPNGSDINLPSESKSKTKPEKSDPLGIRPDSSDDGFEGDDGE